MCHTASCLDLLVQVENAMERLRGNTYGFCGVCNSPIGMERLHRIPFATHCHDCQQDLDELRLRDRFRLF